MSNSDHQLLELELASSGILFTSQIKTLPDSDPMIKYCPTSPAVATAVIFSGKGTVASWLPFSTLYTCTADFVDWAAKMCDSLTAREHGPVVDALKMEGRVREVESIASLKMAASFTGGMMAPEDDWAFVFV
jgi:hypothetical protein